MITTLFGHREGKNKAHATYLLQKTSSKRVRSGLILCPNSAFYYISLKMRGSVPLCFSRAQMVLLARVSKMDLSCILLSRTRCISAWQKTASWKRNEQPVVNTAERPRWCITLRSKWLLNKRTRNFLTSAQVKQPSEIRNDLNSMRNIQCGSKHTHSW